MVSRRVDQVLAAVAGHARRRWCRVGLGGTGSRAGWSTDRCRVDHGVGPRGVGLEPVVSTAHGCGVAGAGRTARPVRDDVVDVAGDGRAGAPREGAGAVADLGLLGQPGGNLVGGDADVLVDVEDRLDDDGGVGGLAPGADLVGEDGAVVVVDLRELETTGGAGERCLGEVHVEHHLPPSLAPGRSRPRARWFPAGGRAGGGRGGRRRWRGVRRASPLSLPVGGPRPRR